MTQSRGLIDNLPVFSSSSSSTTTHSLSLSRALFISLIMYTNFVLSIERCVEAQKNADWNVSFFVT